MEKLNSLADLKKLFPEAEGTYQPLKKVEPDFKKQYLSIKIRIVRKISSIQSSYK